MNALQDSLVEFVERTVQGYRLIADYNGRASCIDQFETVIKDYNGAFTATSACQSNNLYFPRWVTIIVVSVYTILAGGQTIAGEMTLGMFLAEVTVFTQVGEAWGRIYKILLDVQTCLPALERIVRLENLPTDVPQRSVLSAHNKKKTMKLRERLHEECEITKNRAELDLDLMPIEIRNLQMRSLTGLSTNTSGHLEAHQGQLVALVGNRGQGKATLLKVISGVILPRSDVRDPGFFMPSHLRVLHISLEPMFIRGTLLTNLTFGVKRGSDDGEIDRVKAICTRLGLDDGNFKYLDDEVQLDWGAVFSQTQKMIVSLARAFICNPEVMCIHKPTQVFDDHMSLNVMKCLREFVENKGLEMELSTWHLRRPRTCIFTSAEQMNVEYADLVVHVSKSHGIRPVLKQDVTPDMLC